ncbi:hypothetical protein ACFQ7A_15310 [Streptomyces sp. NPDC056528]|uniref:hypothetical protein n=1 Tax=Streptomyces sp. NPDC056528 TaxID=3345854 RepID=UPI0036A0921E
MTTRNPNKPCACASYSFEVLLTSDGGGSVWQLNNTGCIATTQSTFAPGHDAKLKSLLTRAEGGGHPVRRADGGTVVVKDAARVAADLGWGSPGR